VRAACIVLPQILAILSLRRRNIGHNNFRKQGTCVLQPVLKLLERLFLTAVKLFGAIGTRKALQAPGIPLCNFHGTGRKKRRENSIQRAE